MKDFELQMRLRNNRIKARRVELGLSARQLADVVGLSYPMVLEYEGLKESPLAKRGEDPWRPSAKKLAEFFGCSCDELWPEAVLAVKKPVLTMDVDAPQLAMLAGAESARLALPSPEQAAIEHNLSDQVRRVLKTLTPREEKILRMRFGIGKTGGGRDYTRDALGDIEDCSGNRISQIEHKALRKLRHPSRSKQLKAFYDPDYDEYEAKLAAAAAAAEAEAETALSPPPSRTR